MSEGVRQILERQVAAGGGSGERAREILEALPRGEKALKALAAKWKAEGRVMTHWPPKPPRPKAGRKGAARA